MSLIPKIPANYMEIPKRSRGLQSMQNIFFTWNSQVNPANFLVYVEDLSGRWMSLGRVKSIVPLPEVYFPAYAKLAIVGSNGRQQVRYLGVLRGGFTYNLFTNVAGDWTLPASASSEAVFPFTTNAKCRRDSAPMSYVN